jgi:fibronectin type 3 domain-containing protein
MRRSFSARQARRARALRGFLPSVQSLEARLLMTADAEGDSLATALAVSLARGSLYQHQATIGDGNYPAGDVDLYAVPMAAGQHLLVAVEAKALDEGGSLSSLDTYVRLFDASGNQLASNNDSTNPYTGAFSTDSALSFVAPSSASYYVGVTASGNSIYNPNTAGTGSGGGTGAYRLELLLSNSTPLAAPTGLSASSPSPTQINLSWSTGAAATGYTVQRSANGSTGWSTIASLGSGTTIYSDTGLATGTTYYYRVQASNADSISAYSAQASATTVPAAPDGLTATAVSATQINLSWMNHASNIYYTYVAQSTDGTNWTQIATIYAAATSYTATGPFNGSTMYDYRVWTYSWPGGNSAYSPVASVTTPAYPNRPTLNSATAASDMTAVLSWTASGGATGYRAERSSNGGSTWVTAGTTASSATTFTDTGLSEATSYTYRVFATNSVGDSATSNTLSAATMPSAPTGLIATPVSGAQINLSWTDHSSSAYYYYVEQSSDGVSWGQIASLYGSATNSYMATGPFNGSTTYYFRVHAYAYTGGNSAYATASVTTPAFPNQPAISSATAQSDTSVALSWGDVAGETGFRVERSANNGSTWTTAGAVAAGVTSFTDTGLSESNSYTYRVTATNAVGSSAPSATRSVTTLPSAPTGLTATGVSATQINLSWTDHSTAAYYYYVEQSSGGGAWTQIASLYGSSTNSYTATGPFNGSTTYSFRARAYSSGGYSAYAPAASLTTAGYPSQPTLGSATAQSDTSVLLTWSDVAGETGFRVERLVGSTWTAVGTLGAHTTSLTDTGLHEVTSYSYRLFATNSVGDSAPSATFSVTTLTAAPTALTASAVSWTRINLSWTDHSSSASYYYVEQSSDAVTWTQIASLYGSSTNSYTATGPFNGATTYNFRARAYSYNGGYSTYATTSVLTPSFPATPTLSSATPQSDTSIALAWLNVANETGFRVERLVGGTWTAEGTVGVGVTTFTDTGLHEATSYSYHVVATNAVGDSAPSATLSATTLLSAPTGLTASPVSWNQISLSWTDHSFVATTNYVEESTDGVTWIQVGSVAGTATTFSATGPFNRLTTYDFRVRAYGGSLGYSTYASTSVATPAFPFTPAINWAVSQSSTSAALSWTNAPGEAGFRVERSSNGGSTWTTAGTVAAGVTTFTNTGLAEATSYTYRVFATSASGDSIPSATQAVVTPPGAPTGLSAVVISGGQISLNWTDHSAAAAYYVIQQSPNASTGWVQVGTASGSSANSYAGTGPFAGSTTYFFRVAAYAANGGTSAFATTPATTPAFPGQPTLNSATAQSDTAVNLAWSDVPGETGFRVERSTGNLGTWSVAGTFAAGVTSYTDAGLSESTAYWYRVVASNAIGDSAPSATRGVTTPPSAPTGLTAAFVSGGQVNLTWTNRSSAAAAYTIQQSNDGTTWQQVGSTSGSATSFTAGGPLNGSTTYSFRVLAYSNAGGYSGYAMTSATTPAFPNRPTLNSATAQSGTTVALAWSDVAGEAGFRVDRSADNGMTWAAAGTVPSGVTTFTDTGLAEATAYVYRVVATNSSGSSAPSATMSGITQPSAPSGLTATAASPTQVNLSWTDHSTAAIYYYIEQSTDGSTWTQVASPYGSTTTSYTATGPFNGSTTYYFRVHAYAYTGGNSAYAAASVTTAAYPSLPMLNSATAQSDTLVLLAWSDVAGETGFRVERLVSGTWTASGTVTAGVTSFTDTGLHELTSYSYRLFATNSVGNSATSATVNVSTLPSAPTGLAAAPVSGGQVNLTWTDYSLAATYYDVEQSTDGSTWTQVASLYGNSISSYAATGPFASSATYDFRVRAQSSGSSFSTYAPVASVTTAAYPGQPALGSTTAMSDTTVSLTWSDVPGETGFRVDRSGDGGTTWVAAGNVAAGVTSFTDTGLHEATSYKYRVAATNAAGASAPSATKSVATPPSAPTVLTATVISGGQINLSWTDHSTAATSYYVEQSPDGSTGWTQLAALSGTGTTSYTATGPFNGSTTYYFRVHAAASTGGNSAYATTSATTPAVPAQPALGSATALSDTSVALAWADVAGEMGFRIDRSNNSGTTWAAVGTVAAGVTSFTDTGLSESSSYTYRVVATNAAGSSAPSANRSLTTLPSAPTGLAAVGISPTQISLSWTDHSSAASNYYVEQSSDGVSWGQIASLYGSATNSYMATGPFNGSTTYYFRVHAYATTGGNSAYATASVTTPAFPSQATLISAAPQSDTAITLTWTDVPGEAGFRVERSTGPSGPWTVLALLGSGVTTYTDAGLREGLGFTYRVTATNAVGDSAPSAPRSAQTLLSAPTGLTATAVSGGRIDLAWTDQSSLATAYYVEQSADGTTWQQVGSLSGSGINSYTATGPFNGSATYYFRVHAASSADSSAYATTTVTTPAFPNQPALSPATPQSDTAVALAWTDVAGEAGFRVERLVGGLWTAAGTVGAGVTAFTDTGLHEVTSYTYRIFATNAVGDSAPSITQSATTPPTAPANLTATVVSGGQIVLTWTDRSAAESNYALEQSKDGTSWQQIGVGAANNASFNAGGPFNGSATYYFRVRASAGTAGYSAYALGSATTPGFPNQPAGPAATAVSDSSISVSWGTVANATGYRIERSIDGISWTVAGTVASGVTSLVDTGLHEATAYQYRVMATNAAGNSAYSPGVSCTTAPVAPSNLTVATAAGNWIKLTWTDRSSGESGYLVEQSTGPNGPWIGLQTFSPNSTFFSVNGLFDGSTTYYFRVSATVSGVRSAAAITSITTPAWPSAPRNLTVTARSATTNDLSWSPSTGASGYMIQRAAAGTSDWATIATVGAGATSYSDTSAAQGTANGYRVEAENNAGFVASPPAEGHSNQSWQPEPGFTETQLDPNDDLSSEHQVDMGFSIEFGGNAYSKLWVNNNGNVTFDGSLSTFTPFELDSSQMAIIAPYFADVDTRTGFGLEWLPSLDDVDQIPKSGTRTVIAAEVDGLLCFRIFDANSQMVVDTSEFALTDQADAVANVRERLENGCSMTSQDQEKLIQSIGEMVGYPMDHGTVTYGTDEVDGHPAFGVNWNHVGYFSGHADLKNTFQLVLIDRSDVAPGAFQVEFNYDQIQWETGDASGGKGGFGGTPARAGFSDGTGTETGSWELDASGEKGGLLDTNADTGLVNNSVGSDVTGRYTYLLVPDLKQIGGEIYGKSDVPFTAIANQPFSGVVAGFDDPAHPDAGPGDYTAQIDWGDGTTSTGSIDWGGDVYNVSGDHTYAEAGSYATRVTVTSDVSDMNEEIDGTAMVTASDLTLSNPGALSNVEGDQVSVQIDASGGDGSPMAFTATGLPSGLLIDAGTGLITGTIGVGASGQGQYDVNLTAFDDVDSVSQSFTWYVGLPAGGPAVSVAALDDLSGAQADALSPGSEAGSFLIGRDSGPDTLRVYFQLSSTADLGSNYPVTFGPGGGYVDENTGQGYVDIPAGAATAWVAVEQAAGASNGFDPSVQLSLMGAGNEFGGFIGYQMPAAPAAAQAVAQVPAAAGAYEVKGTFQFDTNQNVRYAQVKVYETFPDGALGHSSRLLKETYTDDKGAYDAQFDRIYAGGTGIQVYVFTQSTNPAPAMQSVDVHSLGDVYKEWVSAGGVPTPGNPVTLSGTITSTTTSGQAFWVYDAAVTAALFQAQLPGFQKGTTGLDFPAFWSSWSWAKPTSLTTGTEPHILAQDFNNAETVIHEYGHTVAWSGGFFPLEILPAYARHGLYDLRSVYGNGGQSMVPLEKLAFSEGWADFYSVAARTFAKMPNVTYRGYVPEDNEPRGPLDEIGVMQLFWDLSDNVNDGGDGVSLGQNWLSGVQALYQILSANNVKTVEDLLKFLPNIGNSDAQVGYGAVLTAHGMSPKNLSMGVGNATNNQWVAGQLRPTFKWSVPMGYADGITPGTALPLINEFRVLVFDYDAGNNTYTQIFDSTPISQTNGQLVLSGKNLTNASWTPDEQQWQQIISTGSATKAFVVVGSYRHFWLQFKEMQASEVLGPWWSGASQFGVD